jgi:hypothetical protein
LLSLLKNERVLTEINEYPTDWHNRFRIAFENGRFEATWKVAGIGRDSNVITANEKLEKLCETATVFHDKIKALTEKRTRL